MTCMTASRIRDDHATSAGCTSGPHSETTAKPVKTHMTIAPAWLRPRRSADTSATTSAITIGKNSTASHVTCWGGCAIDDTSNETPAARPIA